MADLKLGDVVYVTRYALTDGIIESEVFGGNNDRFVSVKGLWQSVPIADVHPTTESAQARVREMIAAKRKSIAKQVAKLDRLEADGAKVKRMEPR